MKKKSPEFLIVGGFAILVSVIWITLIVAEKRRLSPPQGINTLAKFAAVMPSPTRLAIIEEVGEKRVVWIGKTGHWSLASGPPCYVFDRSGELVEWNTETGDGQPTTRFVRLAGVAQQFTVAEAIEFIRDE